MPGSVESRAEAWGSCTFQIDSQLHGMNLLTGSSLGRNFQTQTVESRDEGQGLEKGQLHIFMWVPYPP